MTASCCRREWRGWRSAHPGRARRRPCRQSTAREARRAGGGLHRAWRGGGSRGRRGRARLSTARGVVV
eukprot:4050719-Prymnesium_polylepis.1